MNCFLIDDDQEDQEIFCMALRDVNPDIQCMIASDGRQAIEKLQVLGNNVHDFIFIDLNMPKMNGLETLTEIKKLPYLNTARIIIYSTTSSQKIIDEALAMGAGHFIVKPPSIGELKSALKDVFGLNTTTT